MDKEIKKEMKKYTKEELIGIIDFATDDIVELQSKNQQLKEKIKIKDKEIKKLIEELCKKEND